MKQGLIVALGAGLLAGVGLTAQGNPEAAKLKNPIASTAESQATGKVRYLRYCANCHGTNGQGSPGNDLIPLTPSLTEEDFQRWSDGEIFETIKNGVPPEFNMAAWKDQGFKDEDVWNLVNYIRTLPKK